MSFADDINVTYSEAIVQIMEERGISQEDVKAVIVAAEDEGVKLVSIANKRYLAKKRLENFTVYVEYNLSGAEVEVFDVYGHRVNLTEELA